MNKYFHNLVLGVSVLPALLVMPSLAEMEVVQGNGAPVDVLKGTMDQKSDGGRIWLKDFTKGVYTYDAENHTLLLEADDNGQIELSSFSASIQSTNPDHNYPSVTVKGDPNTTITMIGQQGESRDWSIFSRFAPLYVGSEDSPIGLLNVENSTGKGGAIYVTSGNSSFRAEDQDLQIYANDVSLKVNGNSAAITGNEGKLTLVANDTLNIYGNIEGYNNVYGGHADMTLNINQNEGNTAKTIIVGDINSAKGSSVNIGLKGTGSSIMGNLLVSANGTTLPGGKIKLDFGKQGKITGNITAQDAGTVVVNADTNVDINGNISVTANSEFSGKNINLTSTSGTALLSKGADANVTLVGDTNIIAQTVGVRGGNGGSLNIGDTDSSVSIYAKNDDAVEAFYDNSIVNIGGKKVSLHTDATGNAAGIWAQNSTTDTDKTPATVNITADDIEIFAPGAHGVVAMSQGIINLNGNTTIKAKEKAILARGDAQVHINKDTDNTLKMEGNIDFDYDKVTSGSKVDATVDVTLAGADSYWTGNTTASYGSGRAPDESYMKVNSISLTMKDGAVWNATKIVDNMNDDTSGSGYVAMNNLNINKGTVNIADTERGIIVENSTLADATFNGGPLNIKNMSLTGGTNTFNGNVAGVDSDSVLSVNSGATMNIGKNKVDVDTIHLNGTLIADLVADADSILNANTKFDGNGKLSVAIEKAGTYNLFGGKKFDKAQEQVTSTVYDLDWSTNEGKTVIATVKAADKIAEETGVSTDAATAISHVAESESKQLQDLSLKMQEKLAENTPEAKAAVEHATKAVHPEKESVVQSVSTSVQNTVVNLASARMATPIVGRSGGDVEFTSGGVWAQGLFNKSKQADAFNGYTRGIALGMDGTINKDWTIGAGYSYAHSDINGTARNTEIDSNTIFLYGQYKPAQWYVNAIANYTMSDYSERGTVLDGAVVTGDYDVDSFGGALAMGYDFANGITPELGLRYMHVNANDYANSYGINTHIDDTDFLTGVIGAKYAFNVVATRHLTFVPQLNAGVKYDLLSDKNTATVAMPGVNAYTIDGNRLKRIGGEFGIGLGMQYRELNVSVNYDIDVREDYTSQTGMLKFRYNF